MQAKLEKLALFLSPILGLEKQIAINHLDKYNQCYTTFKTAKNLKLIK